MESAQRGETEPRPSTTYMPNVSSSMNTSPMLATGLMAPSPPSAYLTTPDAITKQPTRQMNDPDVTPSLFSLTTLVMVISHQHVLSNTGTDGYTGYETPMNQTAVPSSAQLSSDRLPSERKSREGRYVYDVIVLRTTWTTELRTLKLAIFESEDDDKDEEPTGIVRIFSLKDRPCSKDRHELRTSSEDPSRRHRKKERKGKSIYIGPFTVIHSKRSGVDHTVYLQITPRLPFLCERSPDVTTTATAAADIQLHLTTHLSTPKG